MALVSSARVILSTATSDLELCTCSPHRSQLTHYYGNVSVTDVVEKCSWLSPPVLGSF